jgi:GNAT superfamily N-acetyltransferase
MRREDIPFAIRLSDQEKWGITRADFEQILRLNPRGSFLAYDGPKKLGITNTTTYGRKLGWIGNIVVDKHFRGKRIGRVLVEQAVEHLRKSRISHIALYCFNQHVKFYEGSGFVKDVKFARLKGHGGRRPGEQNSEPYKSISLRDVLAADKRAFGADRARLIHSYVNEGLCWYLGWPSGSSKRASYLLVKQFGGWQELGPWISLTPKLNEQRSLLRSSLARTAKKPIETSCFMTNRLATSLLKEQGFRVVREGYRMYFNEKADVGDNYAQLALGFLDKG